MKQSYASAGKAPRRRVHSLSGIAAIAGCGLPPPRIVIGYPCASSAVRCRTLFVLSRFRVLLTPPAVTRRQSAISSLRARATIIVVLRAPLGPSVRMRYQRASALSFWNTRKRQANWISPRRTRALPPPRRPLFLKPQETPSQRAPPPPYPRIAGLGQALLSAFQTALVG